MKNKKLQTFRLMGCLAGLVLMMFSCNNDSEETNAFDPNKPIVCESFYPSGGPISTQVILRGSNFGSDKDAVRVFFNAKEAPVINVNNGHILVLAPRLPGENVKIKVCIGDKESTFDGEFDYQIQTNISTICGGDASAQTNPGAIENLSEVQFNSSIDGGICVDRAGNIYFEIDSHNSSFLRYVANPESGQLVLIDELGVFLTRPFIVYDDVNDRVYHMQANLGNNEYWYYDPNNNFAQLGKANVTYDDTKYLVDGMGIWGARRAAAMCPADGKFYSRVLGGDFYSFDPVTATGNRLTIVFNKANGQAEGSPIDTKDGETFGMVFDKNNPTTLYYSNSSQNCIYQMDVTTYKISILTGRASMTGAGHLDGTLAQAQFNDPRGMVKDSEGNLYVCDSGNHCIRKINLSTGFVSTVAGLPQQAGYVNGTSEVAKFNRPVGICIDKDDIIYIGDCDNHAIRRLAIE